MTTKHDYEAASENMQLKVQSLDVAPAFYTIGVYERDYMAILHALRIAKALQDGPSAEMYDKAAYGNIYLDGSQVFNLVRDQLYREVE